MFNSHKVGKYEALKYVRNSETAQAYIKACLQEAKPSMGDIRKALAVEKLNILAFAQDFCPASFTLFKKVFEQNAFLP